MFTWGMVVLVRMLDTLTVSVCWDKARSRPEFASS